MNQALEEINAVSKELMLTIMALGFIAGFVGLIFLIYYANYWLI